MTPAAEKPRWAYAFYATSNDYAVGVLVVVKRLIQLGISPGIDLVVLHLPLSASILAKMHEMGLQTRQVQPLPRVRHEYFKHCLVKFRIFQLVEYDRVLYMDADTLPLQNLEHLLSMKFSEDIAAPDAYWLEDYDVTSLLMVIKPSQILWDRVETHFESAADTGYFDMEILNLEFKNELRKLPVDYGCLDSEWEEMNRPFRWENHEESYRKAKVIHFSSLDKPWSCHHSMLPRLRPNAYPVFYDLWRQWWDIRNETLPETFWQKIARLIVQRRALKHRVMTGT